MGDVASSVSLRDCELREVGNDADLLLAEPLFAADPGPPLSVNMSETRTPPEFNVEEGGESVRENE